MSTRTCSLSALSDSARHDQSIVSCAAGRCRSDISPSFPLTRANELFNGRLAMLAITGFAVQEFLWAKPVVEQTPFFFGH